jgi:hypothetical protein
VASSGGRPINERTYQTQQYDAHNSTSNNKDIAKLYSKVYVDGSFEEHIEIPDDF